jgi:hypothetical protein
MASRPEGGSKGTMKFYRIKVHRLGSELLGEESILRFLEQPANGTHKAA